MSWSLGRLGTQTAIDRSPSTVTREQQERVKYSVAKDRTIARKTNENNVFVVLHGEDGENTVGMFLGSAEKLKKV